MSEAENACLLSTLNKHIEQRQEVWFGLFTATREMLSRSDAHEEDAKALSLEFGLWTG